MTRRETAAKMPSSAKASPMLSELASLPTSTSTGASRHLWSGFVVSDLCSTAQSPLPFLIFARSTSAAHMRLTTGTAWKDCRGSRMGSRLVGVSICFAIPRVAFLLTKRSCLACSFFKDPSLSASERIHQTSGRASNHGKAQHWSSGKYLSRRDVVKMRNYQCDYLDFSPFSRTLYVVDIYTSK